MGDVLPVSALPVDGTYPSGTTQWEKRNIALDVPVWDPNICIQCGKCVMVCPHAVIRAKVYEPGELADAPETFKSAEARWKELAGQKYTLQVAVEDCTGCTLCVEACPAKDKTQVGRKAINMVEQLPIRETGSRQLGLLHQAAGISQGESPQLQQREEHAVARPAVRVLAARAPAAARRPI